MPSDWWVQFFSPVKFRLYESMCARLFFLHFISFHFFFFFIFFCWIQCESGHHWWHRNITGFSLLWFGWFFFFSFCTIDTCYFLAAAAAAAAAAALVVVAVWYRWMNEFWTNYVSIGDNTKTHHNSSFHVEYDKDDNNENGRGSIVSLVGVFGAAFSCFFCHRAIKKGEGRAFDVLLNGRQ